MIKRLFISTISIFLLTLSLNSYALTFSSSIKMKETDAYFNYKKDNSLFEHLKNESLRLYNRDDSFYFDLGARIAFIKKCDRDDNLLPAWTGLEKIAYLVNYKVGQKLTDGRAYGDTSTNCSVHSYAYGRNYKNTLDENINNVSKFIEKKYGKDELVKVYDHILKKLIPNLFEKNEIIFYVPYFTNLKEKKEIRVIGKRN